MLYRQLIYIAIVIVAVFAGSCSDEGHCFHGAGAPTVHTDYLETFNKIVVNDKIDLEIIEDTVNTIKVETGANILEYFVYDITDNCLSFENHNRCKWLRSYEKSNIKVTVTCTELNNIEIHQSCTITMPDTLHCDNFLFEDWGTTGVVNLLISADTARLYVHAGTGDFKISGRCKNFIGYNVGYGFLHAEMLESEDILVTSNSTGDSKVWAKNNLHADILYTGDVYYKGNPQNVSVKELNNGRLLKID